MGKFRIDENGNRTTLSEADDLFLRQNYLEIPIKPLGKQIGKSFIAISTRLKHLGLTISPELASERKKKGMFRRGQIPPNKGKKMEEYMSPENLAIFRSNQFQKAHIPHNAKEDWEEVKRKDSSGYYYWMIKLPGKRKLVFKHIWIWEEKNGPVSKGHNIIFKNGNSLDCVLENLECLSNAELMKKNSVQRFPEELRKLIQLKGALKRQINKIEKKQ